MPVSAQAFFSQIDRYDSLQGKNTLVGRDYNSSYLVTVGHKQDYSFFIVSDGTSEKYFYTNLGANQVPTFVQGSWSYHITDMEIEGSTCWFCGYKWYVTGRIIYTLEGATLEVRNTGIVGRFDMADVISGGGNYNVIEIDTVERLDKMTVYVDGMTAVGKTKAGGACVVELKKNLTGTVTYKVGRSANVNEVFMDVVNANGRIVTLSRYKQPNAEYGYYFSLRYGNPYNFLNTGSVAYCYSTYDFFPDDRARFTGVTPMCLSYPNRNHEVVVSCLGTYNLQNGNSLKGHFIAYHILAEGNKTVYALFNQEISSYTALREVRFNYPSSQYQNMSVLLENNDFSVVRFPYLRMNYFLDDDTILQVDNPRIESIMPHDGSSASPCWVDMSGYYPNDFSRIAHVLEYGIHNHLDLWNTMNCFSLETGVFHTIEAATTALNKSDGLVVVRSKTAIFPFRPFLSYNVAPVAHCIDGVTQ